MLYGVFCTRSAASPAGPATAWLRKDGKVWVSADAFEAQEEADRLNDLAKSGNVIYRAQPYL